MVVTWAPSGVVRYSRFMTTFHADGSIPEHFSASGSNDWGFFPWVSEKPFYKVEEPVSRKTFSDSRLNKHSTSYHRKLVHGVQFLFMQLPTAFESSVIRPFLVLDRIKLELGAKDLTKRIAAAGNPESNHDSTTIGHHQKPSKQIQYKKDMA